MTKIRAISAVIAVLSAIGIIYFFGYQGIAVTVFFLSLLGLNEFGRMALRGQKYDIARRYFVALGLIAFSISILRNDLLLHMFVISTLLLFVIFLLMAQDPKIKLDELVNKAGLCLLGILYAGVCPVYICLLATLSGGLEWFIFTLVVVFAGDTTAYFVGRKFGKTKLFRRVSPKKSVEGAMGSLFASVLVGMLLSRWLMPQTDLFLMLSLCVLTSIVAQLGDLCESMIKRTFRTKDSGHIMPGHGGLLDRLDGVLFAAPIVYIFAKYLVIP